MLKGIRLDTFYLWNENGSQNFLSRRAYSTTLWKSIDSTVETHRIPTHSPCPLRASLFLKKRKKETTRGAIYVFFKRRTALRAIRREKIKRSAPLLVASCCARADDANGAVAGNKIARDIPSWKRFAPRLDKSTFHPGIGGNYAAEFS